MRWKSVVTMNITLDVFSCTPYLELHNVGFNGAEETLKQDGAY